MEQVAAASLAWLVAELDRRVIGYAYAGRWHTRAAYRFSTEVGRDMGKKIGELTLATQLRPRTKR